MDNLFQKGTAISTADLRKLADAVEAGEINPAAPMPVPLSASMGGVLDGEAVFDLEQTYGFPGDMTRMILEQEHGLGIDKVGYVCAKLRHLLVSRGKLEPKRIWGVSDVQA